MWAFVAQTALAALATAALVFVYRWIRSRAPLAAFLFAAGLVARIVVGAGLALSWIGSAPAGTLHAPDPRWFPDAQMYYEDASLAADVGLTEISDSQASPTFVRSIALWMRLAGPSHGAAHLLNVVRNSVQPAASVSSKDDRAKVNERRPVRPCPIKGHSREMQIRDSAWHACDLRRTLPPRPSTSMRTADAPLRVTCTY